MENVTLPIIPLFFVVFNFVLNIIYSRFLDRVERLQECHVKSETCEDSKACVAKKNQDFDLPCSSEKKEDVCRGDVGVVMERLGIFCQSGDGKLPERLDPDEISNLFEEKEPSLDEVKGAFDVFDENSDGFIDSRELQRVLGVLGFKEAGEVENCRRMIGLFDENGDGRIDFGEFIKIMENSFC
ncbi:hypothetical protein RHSIM_Rhsim10G0037300 [Rhododendron simsii]|uniref:EF-hand domain-containing protein n=1 Tax=Rhododendron simsii TaxID=118357 RepID=A0A834LDB3_RHOSS|nr:hypothetical protein RHSIM_Rhsim10G0037300 [Rhododendron simsii]